jgi:hypothetical protein
LARYSYLPPARRLKPDACVQAGQLLPEITFGFDLHEGDVRDYPLDHRALSIYRGMGAPGRITGKPDGHDHVRLGSKAVL